MTYKDAEKILETYSLEEILELNEVALEDVLCFLVEQKFIELPEQLPVDYDDPSN